jgi:hypothetical protein
MARVPRKAQYLTIVALICVMALLGSARAGERKEVRDPHFGEVLFHFYQQSYFSALSQLMTAQHFTRVDHHRDEAELLRGGMLLSYGLHLEAGRIFQQLIDAGAPPDIRNRAWFYLAKIRYQRGYLAEAEDAMAHIQGVLPGELEDERHMLHALLLMGREQYRQAVDVLERTPGRSEWASYGRYNLGVALIKVGEGDAGVKLLEQVGREPARTEELAALRDKANVALGYTFIQAQQPARAKTYLERVRLNGPLSSKALLGMGWAHSALAQHERALVPWTELQSRDVMDAAVQESLLAVPYALGKVGAYGQSLEKYEAAIATYTGELARLESAMAAIRRGQLTEDILSQDPGDDMGWFWKMQELPAAPATHYMVHLLASHEFQEALKNSRDLRFVRHNLEEWSHKIQVYRDMLATSRRAFDERLPRVLGSEPGRNLDRLQAARDRQAAELSRIEREGDAPALANEKEQALLARLKRVDRRLAHDDGAAQRDQARLLRGLLAWDLAAEFQPRLRQAKKTLSEVDLLFTEVHGRRAALTRAQRQAPHRFDDFTRRIDALDAKIRRLRDAAVTASQTQEAYLAELAVTTLAQQRERIVTYVTQAKFAVAQMYDQATAGGEERKP